MPAQSALTLNALTYAPSGKTGQVATWTNKDDSAGYPRIADLSVTASPNKDGNHKVVARLILPEVQDSESACGCPGQLKMVSRVTCTFTIPGSLDSTGRTALMTSFANFVASGAFTAAVEDLEPSW